MLPGGRVGKICFLCPAAPGRLAQTLGARVRLLRNTLSVLCVIVGIASLFAAVVPWAAGWVSIIASSGREQSEIRKNGLPTCMHLLAWTDWQDGSGDLHNSTLLENLPAESRIIAHRTGSANDGILSEFTFYQAKYKLPDGSIRVAHADGPKPLISHRQPAVAGIAIGCVVLAIVLLFSAAHLTRRST